MGCKSRSSLPQSLGFEKGKRNIFIGLLINVVFPVGAVLRACFKESSLNVPKVLSRRRF
ncbi:MULTISPECIES: hypothetical protein [unclassified Bartonella]|uniref:hypothetical protein n=1 Tax=unclassified Bartonella TaxID=2645622 RepID=UPI0035CFFA40